LIVSTYAYMDYYIGCDSKLGLIALGILEVKQRTCSKRQHEIEKKVSQDHEYRQRYLD